MGELISVLIPAYNVGKYIARCIESILDQTYPNLEIVIIDDGSTDNTLDICRKYEKEINKIRVVHKENGGISSARNAALREAGGDLIAWIDADDCVAPRYIEFLYAMMKSCGADISLVGYQRFSETIPVGKIDDKYETCDKYYPLKQLTFDFLWVVQWGKLIRKSLYSGIAYPENCNHEDEYVIHELYYKAERIVYSLDTELYFYCENPDSITGKKYNVSRLHVLNALEKRVQFYENHNEEELACLTIKKLLGVYRRHYYMVKEYLCDETIMNDIRDRYMNLYTQNKKRCKINLLKDPELYIIPHQKYKKVLVLMAKIKHKFGFVYW